MLSATGVSYIVTGALMLALAGWVVAAKFSNSVHRALSILLLLRGLYLLFAPFAAEGLLYRIEPYVSMGYWFAAVNLALVLVKAFTKVRLPFDQLRLLNLGLCLFVEAAYLEDHGLWLSYGIPPDRPFFIAFGTPSFIALSAVIGSILAWLARSNRAGWDTVGLSLLSVAFCLEPAYYAPTQAVGSFLFEHDTAFWIELAELLVAIVACGLTLTWTAGNTRLSRRQRTVSGIALATAVCIGFPLIFPEAPAWTQVHKILNVAWIMPFNVVGAYVVLRRRIFHLDLGLKFALHATTMTAILTTIFFALEILLAESVPYHGFFGLIAVAGTALAIRPVHHFATLLAHRAAPHVRNTTEYKARRAEEIYHAAWADIHHHGHATRSQYHALDVLAESLGLTASQVKSAQWA